MTIMPAIMPAKSWPPFLFAGVSAGLKRPDYRAVEPAGRCPPPICRDGGLERHSQQGFEPAADTPRLTTCPLFGGHTSGRSIVGE